MSEPPTHLRLRAVQFGPIANLRDDSLQGIVKLLAAEANSQGAPRTFISILPRSKPFSLLIIGRFEVADKGTLFLDEVGDIPP